MLVREMKKLDIKFFENELIAMTKLTLLNLLQHHSLESIEESSTTKKQLVGRILQAQKKVNQKMSDVNPRIWEGQFSAKELRALTRVHLESVGEYYGLDVPAGQFTKGALIKLIMEEHSR